MTGAGLGDEVGRASGLFRDSRDAGSALADLGSAGKNSEVEA